MDKSIRDIQLEETHLPPMGIDVINTADLRRWQRNEAAQTPHRLPFYAIALVTEGEMPYQVDFQDLTAAQGTISQILPQQISHFNLEGQWQAQIVRFLPEFLPPQESPDAQLFARWQELPNQWQPDESLYPLIIQQIELLKASLRLQSEHLADLLRHQLYSLLNLLICSSNQTLPPKSKRQMRFKTFKQLVENQYKQQHRLADYARQLACTEHSLTRACLEAEGISAKTLIIQRLLLEAKRLLRYTSLPIATIADHLGFADTETFRKFFQKHAGITAVGFRKNK